MTSIHPRCLGAIGKSCCTTHHLWNDVIHFQVTCVGNQAVGAELVYLGATALIALQLATNNLADDEVVLPHKPLCLSNGSAAGLVRPCLTPPPKGPNSLQPSTMTQRRQVCPAVACCAQSKGQELLKQRPLFLLSHRKFRKDRVVQN